MARPMLPNRARPSLLFSIGSLAVAAAVLASPGPARAQEPGDPDPPAHVSFVDGAAVLERDGRPDNAPANMPLLAGDRVRTEGGRVEILFADGSTLHLDSSTTVDFQSDDLVRLLDGRVRLTIAGPSRAVSYRIDAPGAWAQITEPGEYRLSVLRGSRSEARDGVEVELAVLRGAAELVNEDGRTPIRAGERAFARAGVAPSYAYVFNSAAWDAFDRWSEERRDHRLGLSTQYLPDQVRPYSRTFDSYGTWRHEPTYGHVWYPTVHAGWRPYYYGRWASLRPWGWTWIGHDPWAWATHHYGRWGFSAGVWFWIPGRRWGPAWVSWAYSPGYVSWCPLGWDNRPIIQIVNVYPRRYDPWSVWTVVPRRHFGVGVVHANVVPRHVVDTRLRGTFVHRSSAPDVVGYAVPRSSAPIRVAGTRQAGDRRGGDSTVYTNLGRDAARVRTPGSRVRVDGAPESSAPRAVPRASTGGSGVPRSEAGAEPSRRERAAPRSTDPDAPRTVPGRAAVRSLPRGESRADSIPDPSGPRAVPRTMGPGGTSVPERPDYRSDSPSRRAPSGSWRAPESSIERGAPRAPSDPPPGWRAVPRSEPGSPRDPDRVSPYRGGGERPIERRAPPSSYGPPPDSTPGSTPGWRAVPRSSERPAPGPAPERMSPSRGGDRPAPRVDPPSGGGMRAVPRGAPGQGARPSESRGDAPAARPRGGDGGGGGAARRR